MADPAAIPRRHRSTATRVIDAQAVIAFAETTMVQILNDVGTRVWNLIDGKRTVAEIAGAVRGQLEADGYKSVPAELDTDLDAFFGELGAQGLITWSGSES